MSACLSCGAALPEGAERCPLCGLPAGATDPEAVESDALEAAPLDPAAAAAEAPESVLSPLAGSAPRDGRCPACGHTNPTGARFCNACGASLAVAPPPATRPAALPGAGTAASSPPPDPARRALTLVGAAVAAVALLYAVTLFSNRSDTAPAAEGAPAATGTPAVGAATVPSGPPPPLPDTLQAAADRQAALGTPGGYYESGRYYLTAAFEATGTNPEASALWARRAKEEFERSLAQREDPDVRLALAEALRFDPSAPPMQPIAEVQRVLAVAPDHPGAHYLMGDLRLMRAQFQPEWADSARVSFERVVAVAPPGSELRSRAQQALAALASAPAGASAPGGAPPPGG